VPRLFRALQAHPDMSKTYWMLVVDQENLDITRQNGFSVQGIDSRNRRKAVRMTPEDRIIYYVSDRKGFAATATVNSEHFEDHSRIWKHYRADEDFPNRVKISPDVILEPQDYIDARELAPTLEYLKKWPAELWDLAFFGMLHIMPQRDFNLLEEEIKKAGEAAKLRKPKEAAKPAAVPASAAANRRRQKKKAQIVRRRRRTRAKSGSK
jgi:predicted RNA-binding protein